MPAMSLVVVTEARGETVDEVVDASSSGTRSRAGAMDCLKLPAQRPLGSFETQYAVLPVGMHGSGRNWRVAGEVAV